MSIGMRSSWAALVRSGPALVRHARLASGCVLFTYLTLHFLNHSLGNISWQAMERGAIVAEWIWRGPVGTFALYGAFAVHLLLAFWALYARRHLRMGATEALRYGLGLLIPPLTIQHAVALRVAWSYFDIHRVYQHVLFNIWVTSPQIAGLRQVTVLFVAWLHGCIGLHLYLRLKPYYRRLAPFLLAFAVLLPATALLGVFQGARQVEEKVRLDPAWQAEMSETGGGGDAAVEALLNGVVYWLWAGYAGALVLVLLARGVRVLVERRGGGVRVRYPDGRVVRIPVGLSVLDASRRAGIPHAAVCGGRARCSTCRIRVLTGLDRLPPPAPAEIRALTRTGTDRAVRLACQLKPTSDISILPLLPPDVTVREQEQVGQPEIGVERFLAILFVDIRQSTQLVEHRLPFDVVFLFNRFCEAVGSAVLAAGGMPTQFSGDGVMAIFGIDSAADEACRQALLAARLIDRQLSEMSRSLAEELAQPIAVGIGIHGGEVIVGTMGYREHSAITAIGDTVHVASRLQELTKEYDCQLIVSEAVGRMAGIALDDYPSHEVQLRGRDAPLTLRVIDNAAALGWVSSADTGIENAPVTQPSADG
jgi:adenylate cyclase